MVTAERSCRLWLEKQEKAFQIWLNALLAPQTPAPEDDGGLAAKRLFARVRGQTWHIYCSDPGVIGVMTHLEKRVDEGFLRMKDEVSWSWRLLLSIFNRETSSAWQGNVTQ
jgi:hypothetical protein